LDEREAKLKALTTNIQQSIAKSTPVRQTKLAYVDGVAKPPRNVARQQVKYPTEVLCKYFLDFSSSLCWQYERRGRVVQSAIVYISTKK
jgi:hypothetical protein